VAAQLAASQEGLSSMELVSDSSVLGLLSEWEFLHPKYVPNKNENMPTKMETKESNVA
jgi:hypothetical protein